MKKITQKLTKSIWQSGLFAMAFLFSLTINSQDLVLQGIIDFDVPSAGSDGKAIHVLVVNDIADLSLYGIGVANNGGGTDGQEYTFPSVSVSAGDNIMVARSPEAMASFLGATEANIMLANSDIGQNGDDAIELYFNEAVIETFGDVDTDGTGEAWEYTDSFAYKVDGAWVYAGINCTDDAETSATSACPYTYTGVYTLGTENEFSTFDVTFSVNTANITVGENGMYAGGGVLGGSDAYAMTDDGTGTWTVTIALNEGTSGNYIFLNSPNGSSDWGTKEDLAGQECADAGNYNDRILAAVTADTTLLHCFGNCTSDGTCTVATACGVSVTYTQVASGNYTESVTAEAGQTASVTVNGYMEVNYDSLTVTDGAGNVLNTGSIDGAFVDAVYTSTDGTISVTILNDTSVQGNSEYGADVTLAFTCADPTFNVTFSVNTANITVGELGMYVGGGVLGGANAYAMTDDGTGTWTVTVALAAGTTGNYTLLNSPTSDSDWGAKEDISGQECADAANYNDRILAEVTADTTLLHCFGTCDTDGTCSVFGIEPGCSDFEGDDGTAGWTTVDAGGATSDWLIDTPANGDSAQSMGHGYLPGDVAYNDWLVSPGYNTSGLDTPTLTYFEYVNWSADGQVHNVLYSLDYDGDATTATWELLSEDLGLDAEDIWVERTFSLPLANNVVVAFQYGDTYGSDWNIDDVCIGNAVVSNDDLLAFLGSGSWRSDAETAGHIGVGPSGSNSAEWWNANPYDKAGTGLYDDRWSFADGVLTVDTGDDGAIFGKKLEIDAAFPDNTAYDADNGDNEYLYYTQDDYTDTFVADAVNNTITFATNGNLGFFTSVAGQEFQILEMTESPNTVYVRNVGSEGNAWYNRLTTADALSTVEAMVLDMRIYPNPSNGSYVTIQTPINGVKYVEVFDITGKRLINTSLSADTLDVSSMSSGMYLVKVTIEGQSKTSKLIIR